MGSVRGRALRPKRRPELRFQRLQHRRGHRQGDLVGALGMGGDEDADPAKGPPEGDASSRGEEKSVPLSI